MCTISQRQSTLQAGDLLPFFRLDDDRSLFVQLHTQLFPNLVQIGTLGVRECLQNAVSRHPLDLYLKLLNTTFGLQHYDVSALPVSLAETGMLFPGLTICSAVLKRKSSGMMWKVNTLCYMFVLQMEKK